MAARATRGERGVAVRIRPPFSVSKYLSRFGRGQFLRLCPLSPQAPHCECRFGGAAAAVAASSPWLGIRAVFGFLPLLYETSKQINKTIHDLIKMTLTFGRSFHAKRSESSSLFGSGNIGNAVANCSFQVAV